jgi:prepilin peptidase CpaA
LLRGIRAAFDALRAASVPCLGYPRAMLPVLAHAVLFLALAVACVTDLHRREIPDSCSIAILAAFAVTALAAPIGWVMLASALSAGLAAFAIGAFLFHRGVMGGGDVKLLAAVAVWAGWALLPSVLMGMALAGGVLALLCLAAKRSARPWATLLSAERGIPYGVAIAVGALIL